MWRFGMGVAGMLAVAMALIGCDWLPPSGMTCDGVAPEVCEQAFQHVRATFEEAGEVVQTVRISPTGRVECLHDDLPLADVVVRLEGKPDPVFLTIGRTSEGRASVCF